MVRIEKAGEPGRTPRVVLLDRDLAWLGVVADLLRADGFIPVAQLSSPKAALAALEANRPDVLIVGVETGVDGVTGLDCIREARSQVGGLKVIAVSETHGSDAIGKAFRAGAHACVVKTAQPDGIMLIVRQLFSPTVYFAHDMTRNGHVRQVAIDQSGLSQREAQILELVASGATNSQVARHLWVTEQTIKFHLNSIFKKLGLNNRTQASNWAHQHCLTNNHPAARAR